MEHQTKTPINASTINLSPRDRMNDAATTKGVTEMAQEQRGGEYCMNNKGALHHHIVNNGNVHEVRITSKGVNS